MHASQEQPLDFDALIARENASPIRHEFISGRLYSMAGETARHVHVLANLRGTLSNRLRGQSCRNTGTDLRVYAGNNETNWFYPDILIKCSPALIHPRDTRGLLNPKAIFEVLSPETERFDRITKFDQYAFVKELTDFVLVDSEIARVEHFKRLGNGAWELRVYSNLETELRLDNLEISVPISEIYQDVEMAEQLVLPQFEVPE